MLTELRKLINLAEFVFVREDYLFREKFEHKS